MQVPSEVLGEWHLEATSTDAIIGWLGLVVGLAALGGGIYVAAAGLVLLGSVMAVVGTAILGTVAWVYYLRAVRRVVENVDGSFTFQGPRVSIRASAGDVQSLTGWWITGWLPLAVRTRHGNFFLPTDLAGFPVMLARVLGRNSIESVPRYPL